MIYNQGLRLYLKRQLLFPTPQKMCSNISTSWIMMNKHLLEWSRQHKYCTYTLQIWHNEYSIYAKFQTNESMKNIGPNLLCTQLCNVNISLEDRFWSSNYTPESVSTTKPCCVTVWINQEILAIAVKFTCAPIYTTGAGLKIVLISPVCHESQCITQTQKTSQIISQYLLYGHVI